MPKKDTWSRNTAGMIEAAKKKREAVLERTEKAIRQLIKENKPINFHTVAQAANVSVPWLYKEIEIKERIQQLREQQKLKIKLNEGRKPSDASKDAMIAALKKRIKGQEEEIQKLKQQLKVAYGQVRINQDYERTIEALKARNSELEKQLQQAGEKLAVKQPIVSKKVTSITKKSTSISDPIKSKLDELGIKLNSTLAKKIKAAPEETVLAAIEALKDQLSRGEIKNPGGWLATAIEDGWVKAESIDKKPSRKESQIFTAPSEPQKELVSLNKLQQLSTIFGQDND